MEAYLDQKGYYYLHNPETIRFSREVEKPPSSGKISDVVSAKSNSPTGGQLVVVSIVTLESWRGKRRRKGEQRSKERKRINGVVKSEMGSRVTTIQLKPIPYYRCLLASISSPFPSLISPSIRFTFVKLIADRSDEVQFRNFQLLDKFYGSIFLHLVAIVFSILEINLGSLEVLRIGARIGKGVISQARCVVGLDRCLQEHISSIIDRRK